MCTRMTSALHNAEDVYRVQYPGKQDLLLFTMPGADKQVNCITKAHNGRVAHNSLGCVVA